MSLLSWHDSPKLTTTATLNTSSYLRTLTQNENHWSNFGKAVAQTALLPHHDLLGRGCQVYLGATTPQDLTLTLCYTRCLKITGKVSFNIASEASYVYILSGQKLIKIAKNGPFWRVFENLKLAVKQCYQTGQFKIGQKLMKKAKVQKFKCDIFSNFQTMCYSLNLLLYLASFPFHSPQGLEKTKEPSLQRSS